MKLPGWQPERDDEGFELRAKYCFVTGISLHGVDEEDVSELRPVRHGVSQTTFSNESQADVRRQLLSTSIIDADVSTDKYPRKGSSTYASQMFPIVQAHEPTKTRQG